MADLKTIVQGWKCHKSRPLNCKNCPYSGTNSNKGCCIGLEEDTFNFLIKLMEIQKKGSKIDETMAYLFN